MPKLPIRLGVLVAASLFVIAAPSPGRAQTRFQLLTPDHSADVTGLQIFTIRDNRLAACYTIFVVQTPAATFATPSVDTPTQPPSQEELASADVLRRVREAAATRDQQMAALRASIDTSVARGRNPVSDEINDAKYEAAQRQIDGDYQRAIAPLLPGYPWAASTPGMRTGGFGDIADTVRRGLASPDPGTLTTSSEPGAVNAQVESLLQHMIEAPSLAVAGPTPCDQGGQKPAEERKSQ